MLCKNAEIISIFHGECVPSTRLIYEEGACLVTL
jgi:hypothetical protein